MSDEQSHPEPIDTSAVTIWDAYPVTREWIGGVCVVLMTLTLLGSLIPFFAAIFNDNVSFFPTVLNQPWEVIFLLGIQATLYVALCTKRLGTGRWAIRASYTTGVFWLISVTEAGYRYRSIRVFDELLNLETVSLAAVLLFLGGSIFFINYLLWRTNKGS